MNIVQALQDRRVLGFAFANDTWRTWRVILAGAYGLPLDPADTETFVRLTKRTPPQKPVRELWAIAGRRGGKSMIAAAVACYLATLKRWVTSPGEVPTVMAIAADRDQARVVFRYCVGLLEASPILAREVVATTADTIRLASGIEIVIGTSDKASVRGRTLIAVVCDELAFWGVEAEEVLRAVRPGMASQPEAMLIAISTAYSQRGPLFEAFKRYYGTDDPSILVVRASTLDLNPNITTAFIDGELARDSQSAAAEYLSEFRSDLLALLDAALLDSATRAQPRELPYRQTTNTGTPIQYHAAIDASGGRSDACAASIAHAEGDRVILDAVRYWQAPHDPAAVAVHVAAFLKEYRLVTALADQYAAEFSRSVYRSAGVQLLDAPVNRSESYLHLLPLFTQAKIEIPDDQTLRVELLGLERKVGKSGKDSVDHRPGSHDDVSNSVALAAFGAAQTIGRGMGIQFEVRTYNHFADYADLHPAAGSTFSSTGGGDF
jgi:hypothetical protein